MRIESRAGPLALSRATADRLGRALVATLEDFHAENPDLVGIGMERLRTSLEPRLPAPAFQALLQAEARAGRLALDGAWVRLAGHEVRLSPEDEVLWEEARPLIGGAARFRPPRVRDLAAELDLDEAEVRRLCKLLARMGRVHEVAHDHFFLRDTVGEMVAIAAELDAERRPVQRRRSSATGSTTAARSRSRSSSSSTATASPCDAATCAASTPGGSTFSRATARSREEKRPRWGVRTSNPGGAVRRSLVGSNSHSLPPLEPGTA